MFQFFRPTTLLRASANSSRPTDSRGGFAIAVIFATLLAIALVLGYLSLSSQNAVQSSGNAEAKGFATGLQQGALKLKNGMDRFLMAGGIADNAIYAYKAMDTNTSCVGAACLWNRPQNLFGPQGAASVPTFDVNAYETSAVTCTPDDLASESASFNVASNSGRCVFYLTKISSTSNFYSNTTDAVADARQFIVFYTGPVKTRVCQQLNNILWQNNLEDAVPLESSWSSPQKLGVSTTLGGTVGIVAQGTTAANNGTAPSTNTVFPSYSGSIRSEGCLNANTAASPANWYIKSLHQSN
jgi:hypothetical protein